MVGGSTATNHFCHNHQPKMSIIPLRIPSPPDSPRARGMLSPISPSVASLLRSHKIAAGEAAFFVPLRDRVFVSPSFGQHRGSAKRILFT